MHDFPSLTTSDHLTETSAELEILIPSAEPLSTSSSYHGRNFSLMPHLNAIITEKSCIFLIKIAITVSLATSTVFFFLLAKNNSCLLEDSCPYRNAEIFATFVTGLAFTSWTSYCITNAILKPIFKKYCCSHLEEEPRSPILSQGYWNEDFGCLDC